MKPPLKRPYSRRTHTGYNPTDRHRGDITFPWSNLKKQTQINQESELILIDWLLALKQFYGLQLWYQKVGSEFKREKWNKFCLNGEWRGDRTGERTEEHNNALETQCIILFIIQISFLYNSALTILATLLNKHTTTAIFDIYFMFFQFFMRMKYKILWNHQYLELELEFVIFLILGVFSIQLKLQFLVRTERDDILQ